MPVWGSLCSYCGLGKGGERNQCCTPTHRLLGNQLTLCHSSTKGCLVSWGSTGGGARTPGGQPGEATPAGGCARLLLSLLCLPWL